MSESIVHKCAIFGIVDKDIDIVLNMARQMLSNYGIRPVVMFTPTNREAPNRLTGIHFAVDSYTSDLSDMQGKKILSFMDAMHQKLSQNQINHNYGFTGGGGFFANTFESSKRVYKTAELYCSLDDLIKERQKAAQRALGNDKAEYPAVEVSRDEPWRKFNNWQALVSEGGEAFYTYETQQMTEQEIARLEDVLRENGIQFEHKVSAKENPANKIENERAVVVEDNPKTMIQINNASEDEFWRLMTEASPAEQDGIDNDKWMDVKNWRQVGTSTHSCGWALVYDLRCVHLSNREKLRNFLTNNAVGYTEIDISHGKNVKHPAIEIQEDAVGDFIKVMNKLSQPDQFKQMLEIQNRRQR